MFKKLLLRSRRRPSFWGVRAMFAVRLTCAFLAVSVALLSSMQVLAASGKPATGQKNMAPLPACSWDQPGHNPFMGDVVAAVDRYPDIPVEVRARLKQRMAQRDYDDIVSIRRDSLAGTRSYNPAIRDMHFGVDRVCTQVSRQKWTAERQERGLVYCEGSHCILVPTVCRNVSRITRLEPLAVMGANPLGDELLFDAPGAGEIIGAEPGAPGPHTFAAQSLPANSSDPGVVVPETELGDPDNVPRPVPPLGGGYPGNLGSLGIPGGPGSPGTPGTPVAPIPEPGTWALMLLGLAACSARAARRRSRNA